jgi:hypothetical protein
MALQTGLHPAQLKDSVTSEPSTCSSLLTCLRPALTVLILLLDPDDSSGRMYDRRSPHAGRRQGSIDDGESDPGRHVTRRRPWSEQELGVEPQWGTMSPSPDHAGRCRELLVNVPGLCMPFRPMY